MPTLNWIGKDKVINHHLDVPFRVLDLQYTFSTDDREKPKTESENKIIRGDNLEALKALLPRYEGKVKCIYIDPPYNTGNEGWVYSDNVNAPQIRKWLGQVVGKEGEDLSRHDKWLCMMYPRLKLLQRLLASDGAIFISIDDNEQANLKLICDEIFGEHCFITDLIWRSADSSNNDAKQFSNDFNHTLIYSRVSGWQPKKFERTDDNNQHYTNPDNDPRGAWFSGNVSSPNPRANLMYDVVSPNGIKIHPPKNGWRWSRERMEAMILENVVVFSEDGTRIIKKTFLSDQSGIVPSNIWWDVDETGHNRNAKYEILKLFPELKSSDAFKTPKPTKFIERILKLIPDENAIVLDSFAGSGTTAHAVLNLNKQDGGNRRFILVEMEDYAETTTAERVRRVVKGYGEGNGAVQGTGGDFSFYDLGEPLLIGDMLNPHIPTQRIREYVYFMETKTPMQGDNEKEPYLLGIYRQAAYYFVFEPHSVTVLDDAMLTTIQTHAEEYVIYADRCALGQDEMARLHITFKKIPRDITRL